jgi:hypothetical protein
MSDLTGRVAGLLRQAAQVYAGSRWEARLHRAEQDVGGPLRVALAGRVSSGKSTLLNALVGDRVASTDAGECTRVVTWYSRGDDERAVALLREPAAPTGAPLRLARDGGRLAIDLDGYAPAQVARVDVRLDNASLDGLTLIDTPGTGSLTPELGATARRFLTGDDAAADAPDAIVYLMRQLHVSDTDFLEAFRDPSARGVPPVNAVAVVSRADETGGGRDDALDVARSIATGYARESRLRPYVQTVLPVAGLLAAASTTLDAGTDADLRAIAALSPAVTDPMLLSAERFGAPRRYVPVAPPRRAELVEDLGLFGVRWALEEIRAGRADDATTLRRQMAAASGLGALQDVLRSQIIDRRDVLKADAALRLVQRVVAEDERAGSRQVAARAEELRLGVHDFAELRLLNDLRLGLVEVDDTTRLDMETLLGARGGSAAARLQLGEPDADLDQETLRERLLAEHARWQAQASDPISPPSVTRAAAVLQRTVEGLWAAAIR